MTARFERSKECRSLFERCYVLTLEVLRDGHILRILVREMFIDKGLDVCEARTLRGPVAALPVNDFVVLAAASYADRLQLARLLHTQGEFIQRRLIQIAARVIGAANDPIQLQKDDRRSGRSALRSGRLRTRQRRLSNFVPRAVLRELQRASPGQRERCSVGRISSSSS